MYKVEQSVFTMTWYIVDDSGQKFRDESGEEVDFPDYYTAHHYCEHLNIKCILNGHQEELTKMVLILTDLIDSLPENLLIDKLHKNTNNNGDLN